MVVVMRRLAAAGLFSADGFTLPFLDQTPFLFSINLDRKLDMRLSGLQKSVVALYRSCLRETRKKPVVSEYQMISFG